MEGATQKAPEQTVEHPPYTRCGKPTMRNGSYRGRVRYRCKDVRCGHSFTPEPRVSRGVDDAAFAGIDDAAPAREEDTGGGRAAGEDDAGRG